MQANPVMVTVMRTCAPARSHRRNRRSLRELIYFVVLILAVANKTPRTAATLNVTVRLIFVMISAQVLSHQTERHATPAKQMRVTVRALSAQQTRRRLTQDAPLVNHVTAAKQRPASARILSVCQTQRRPNQNALWVRHVILVTTKSVSARTHQLLSVVDQFSLLPFVTIPSVQSTSATAIIMMIYWTGSVATLTYVTVIARHPRLLRRSLPRPTRLVHR